MTLDSVDGVDDDADFRLIVKPFGSENFSNSSLHRKQPRCVAEKDAK